MFDYKGYTEEELLSLCDEKNVDKGGAKWVFWQSEVYSYGTNFRSYGYFPKKLQLNVISEHGVGNEEVFSYETDNDARAMLTFNKNKVENFTAQCKKPCHIVLHPYVWYRKQNNIKQSESAKGTIVFPAHSTPDEETSFDIEKYIETLKALPEDMQPVCVSLHMHDINKGQHKIFLKHGIPVYTAGHAFDIRFAQRYYDILKNFKYAASNNIGSYVYYAVDLGIPFSLFGEKAEYFNISNKYRPEDNFSTSDICHIHRKTAEIFNGIHKTITKEQQEFVDENLGKIGGISRLKLAQILYTGYLTHKIKKLLGLNKDNSNNSIAEAACPLCGRKTCTVEEYIQTSDILEWYKKSNLDASYLFNTETIEKRKCKNCSLTFFTPVVEGDSKFYSHLQQEEEYFIHDDRYEYKYAASLIKPNDKVLDVGAGRGEFSRYAKCNYQGLDFSEKALALAKQDGINVINQSVQEHSLEKPEYYDYVVLFELIEHIFDTSDIIEACVKSLKKGGKMIISSPNNDGFIKDTPNGYLNLPPHHVLQWNKKSFEKLAEKYNLKIKNFHCEKVANIHKQWFWDVQKAKLIRFCYGKKFTSFEDANLRRKKKLLPEILYKTVNPILKIGKALNLQKLFNGQGMVIVLEK